MPYDYLKTIEMAIEIADVFALSSDFNMFVPIARMLLFPTIYESDIIYEQYDGEAKLEEKIKETQTTDSRVTEKLMNKDNVLEQLTFMKKFYTKLFTEQDDVIKYTEANQPDIILSASVNRVYLNLLLAYHKYNNFYSYTCALKKEVGNSKFGELVQKIIDTSYSLLSAHLKESAKDQDDKNKDVGQFLTRVEETIVMILNLVYSSSISPYPDELSDILDSSLRPLTLQLERGYLSIIKTRETDPSKPAPKSVVASESKSLAASRAKAFTERLKEITEGKFANGDGILFEKDLKRLHNSLAGFS